MTVFKVGTRCTYKTIEAALVKCKPKDTIRLSPGRYEETLVIGCPGLTLEGMAAAPDKVVLAPSETQFSTLRIHETATGGVTVKNLTIQGQPVHTSNRDNDDDWPSALLLEAPDVTVESCIIRGQASLGVTVEAPRASLQNCDIQVLKSAVLCVGKTASVSMNDCHVESMDDTGVWLEECSSCAIQDTHIVQCGRVGVYVRSAASRICNVQVASCKVAGIVLDRPTSKAFTQDEYETLQSVGHDLTHVKVENSEQHGLEINSGVRVQCQESQLIQNGGSGVLFMGWHDPERAHENSSNSRICLDKTHHKPSLFRNCTISSNREYGIEAEKKGLVKLQGQMHLKHNQKGSLHNVAWPRKRKRILTDATNNTSRKRTTRRDSNETASTADLTDVESLAATTENDNDDDALSLAPSVGGASTMTASTAVTTGEIDHCTRQQQEQFDRYRDEIPVAIVTKKAGIRVPKDCWPPSLIFLGHNNNVSGWPPIHELQGWYLTHKVKCNNNVRIKPSPGRGLGCYAARQFRKGATIGYYTGKLQEQVPTRQSKYIATYCKPVRLENLEGEWEIDAEYGGNEMRFINYPSENAGERANVKAESILLDGLPVIAIKALTTIRKKEELLWDYGNDYFVPAR